MSTLTKVGTIVDKRPHRKNLIVNGNMNIKQNSNANYGPDLWQYRDSGIGHDHSRSTDSPPGSNYSYLMESPYTDSVSSFVRYFISCGIEGVDFYPLVGNTGTLSFYVKSTETGIHCVSFRNTGEDRSYVAEYTINQASTWEKKFITLDFDYSGGTWDYLDGLGLEINFMTDVGSTYIAPSANTWLSGNYYGTSNQTNHNGSADAEFYLSQVQLEVGKTATDFDFIGHQEELYKVIRYYQEVDAGCNGIASSGGDVLYGWVNWQPMRTTPTRGSSAVSYTNCGSLQTGTIYSTGCRVYCTAINPGFTEAIMRFKLGAQIL
jgi:hypothetical protein